MGEFRLRSAYPVSPACPGCGGTAYRRVEAETSLAFTDDRVCRQCGTRYTPPTPTWARVVFAVLALGLLALAGVLASWALGSEVSQAKGVATALGCGLVGLGCLYLALFSR